MHFPFFDSIINFFSGGEDNSQAMLDAEKRLREANRDFHYARHRVEAFQELLKLAKTQLKKDTKGDDRYPPYWEEFLVVVQKHVSDNLNKAYSEKNAAEDVVRSCGLSVKEINMMSSKLYDDTLNNPHTPDTIMYGIRVDNPQSTI